MTTIAEFIAQQPLLMLYVPAHEDEFPGAVFPLADGFVTVGPVPPPGAPPESGKDAHVFRGPWRINEGTAELVVEDLRGLYILAPPVTREDTARVKANKITAPEALAAAKQYAISWFPELEGQI